jgi:hypothetical protein
VQVSLRQERRSGGRVDEVLTLTGSGRVGTMLLNMLRHGQDGVTAYTWREAADRLAEALRCGYFRDAGGVRSGAGAAICSVTVSRRTCGF